MIISNIANFQKSTLSKHLAYIVRSRIWAHLRIVHQITAYLKPLSHAVGTFSTTSPRIHENLHVYLAHYIWPYSSALRENGRGDEGQQFTCLCKGDESTTNRDE